MANGAILGQIVEIPQPVDTVASGNMNAVTSNAVYQALQNLPAGVQIATGSYAGTGTYGVSNPNSITLPFDADIVWIYASSVSGAISNVPFLDNNVTILPTNLLTSTYKRYVAFFLNEQGGAYGKKVGNTIYWYNENSAAGQLNYESNTYYYISIKIGG